MSIDTNKLENVRTSAGKTIARCPACAEEGMDKKSEHLFIDPDGRFGCIRYPGREGIQHRKRIFKLVGIRQQNSTAFYIKTPRQPVKEITTANLLGRLGRLSFTHAGTLILKTENKDQDLSEPRAPVPVVPKTDFSPEEQRLLTGIDTVDLQQIALIKNLFNGTVIRVTDKKSNDLGKNRSEK